MKTLVAVILAGCSAFASMSAAEGPTHGNRQFAFDLYGQLQTTRGNLFLSPYSISSALAMAYGGARGKTAAQMAAALHFENDQTQVHPEFAALRKALEAVQAKHQVRLSIANSLWPQKGHAFLPDYLTLCKRNYGAAITPVDFAGATEQARVTINNWVDHETNGKIKNLFQTGVLDKTTSLALVNAIYFKGDWASQFDAKLTESKAFHRSAGGKVDAPLMHIRKSFQYCETPELQLLELPYAGNDLSMLVILPRQQGGLPVLERMFDDEHFAAWTNALRQHTVEVWLPRFKVTAEFSLGQTLANLGMTDAFTGQADFSGMTGTKDLYISVVVHKAFVEVNEKGTEAAAATGVGILRTAEIPHEEPVIFRADHPFLFVIRDNQSGSLLFVGRIENPAQ